MTSTEEFHLLTLQDVGRTHVDLCDHDEHRDVQGQCQTQVLFGHTNNARIAANLRTQKSEKVIKKKPTRQMTSMRWKESPMQYEKLNIEEYI